MTKSIILQGLKRDISVCFGAIKYNNMKHSNTCFVIICILAFAKEGWFLMEYQFASLEFRTRGNMRTARWQ
jgi:hypothetical protein